MSKSIKQIKTNISNWDQIKNTNVAIDYLTSGSGFSINYDDYKKWQEQYSTEPTNINCYFGVVGFTLEFYIVDSTSDKEKRYILGKNLFTKRINKNIESESFNSNSFSPIIIKSADKISKEDAEKRILDWTLSSNDWFKSQQANQYEILRLITIPFNDVRDIFSMNPRGSISAIFALNNFDTNAYKGYNLELILTHSAGVGPNKTFAFYDVSRPRPPFGVINQGFNLLS